MSERLQELSLEYALGTLDGDELRELQGLLDAGDRAARQAVEEARETVAALALTAPEAVPGQAVKTQLLDRIAPEAAHAPFPGEQKRSLSVMPALGWAVAAGALVFAVLQWREVTAVRQELVDLEIRHEQVSGERERLAESAARFDRILEILSAPTTRTVALEATANPRVNAYWNEQLGLVLAGSNLPQPDPGRTLQLWIVPSDGDPISVDVFAPNEQGAALVVADTNTPFDAAAALAISDEPEGGSPAPTTTPVWVGPVAGD